VPSTAPADDARLQFQKTISAMRRVRTGQFIVVVAQDDLQITDLDGELAFHAPSFCCSYYQKALVNLLPRTLTPAARTTEPVSLLYSIFLSDYITTELSVESGNSNNLNGSPKNQNNLVASAQFFTSANSRSRSYSPSTLLLLFQIPAQLYNYPLRLFFVEHEAISIF
jgi:hypothetical protein